MLWSYHFSRCIDVYAHVEDIMRSPVSQSAIKQGITLVIGVAMEGPFLR